MKKLNWLAAMAVASMALLGCENGTTDNNTPDTPDTPVAKYDTSVEVIGENTASTNEAVNVANPLTEGYTIAAPTAGWGRSNYTYTFENPVNLKDLTIKITVKGTGAAKPEDAADGLKVYFVDSSDEFSSECITLGWLGTEETTLTGSVMNPVDGYSSDWSTGEEVKTYNNYDISKISKVVIMNYQYVVDKSNWDCKEGSGVAANLTSFELSAEAEPVGKLATLNAQSNWNDNASIEVALPKTLQNTGKFKITISGKGPTAAEVFGTDGTVEKLADGIKLTLTDSEGTGLGDYVLNKEIPEGITITADNANEYNLGYFNTEGKIEATFSLSKAASLNAADGISKIKFSNYTWAMNEKDDKNKVYWINSSKVLIDSFKIEAITE